jgi:UDP-N-acetylmuramate dehydrogenase
VRNKKYPPGLKCPGSFFKNILVTNVSKKSLELLDQTKIIEGKIPAGYLLEEVGAKGLEQTNLRVARFHGNLIINKGKATSGEVKRFAAVLQEKVFKKFGIKLEEEVRYLS